MTTSIIGCDFTALEVSLSRISLTGLEEGVIEGCVVLNGGRVDRNVTVDLFTVDGTATCKSLSRE